MSEQVREDGIDVPWPQDGDTDSLWTLLTREPPDGCGWEEDEALNHLRAIWIEARLASKDPT